MIWQAYMRGFIDCKFRRPKSREDDDLEFNSSPPDYSLVIKSPPDYSPRELPYATWAVIQVYFQKFEIKIASCFMHYVLLRRICSICPILTTVDFSPL